MLYRLDLVFDITKADFRVQYRTSVCGLKTARSRSPPRDGSCQIALQGDTRREEGKKEEGKEKK